MNDTFIPPTLRSRSGDRDSCFAQHRHKGSDVFCPQHSGSSCPCAQTDDSAHITSIWSRLFDSGRWVLPRFAGYWSRCVLFSCLTFLFSLSSLLVQSVRGPFCRVLARGKSSINPQRCSHEGPFVVILLVMLLLSVVFNNSTIYGQKI